MITKKPLSKSQIWGITTLFNPANYQNKISNYKLFRKSLKKQGLPLVTVELAFDNKPFELNESDADVLVQVRSNSILWHKERLLNIALKYLPKHCTKIVWIDADIIFLNGNWVKETEKLLDTYSIVQPFEYAIKLKKKDKISTLLQILSKNSKELGLAKSYVDYNNKFGHSGFAWAANASIFKKNKFYDTLIFGSGDYILAQTFFPDVKPLDSAEIRMLTTKHMFKFLSKWFTQVQLDIGGKLFYTRGDMLHLYHGDYKNRLYYSRRIFLKICAYDPNKDLVVNADDCYEFRNKNSILSKTLRLYFFIRDDNLTLVKKALPLIIFPFYIADQLLKKYIFLKKKRELLKVQRAILTKQNT